MRLPHPIVWPIAACLLFWVLLFQSVGGDAQTAPALGTAAPQEPTRVEIRLEIPVDPRSLVYLVDLPSGWGSCVPIHRWADFTVFLTCKHVVEAAQGQPFAIRVGASRLPVLRAEIHPELDAALLLVQVQVPVVQMDAEPVRFGDHVFASGWTMMRHMLTDGYVSDDTTCSASIFPGMSGGGVFRNGKLVGIIEAVGMAGLPIEPFGGGVNVPVTFIHVFTPISAALPWIQGMLPR